MSNWKEAFTSGTPCYVEEEVAGKKEKFWPVSVGMAFKLRRLGGSLAKALSVLFGATDRKQDQNKVIRQFASSHVDEKGKAIFDFEDITEAITPAMAELRLTQRQQALEGVIEALTSEENMAVVGDIIKDSMRERFKKDDPTVPPGQEVFSMIPLPFFPSVLTGLAKANKGVFGPLGEQMGDLVQQFKTEYRITLEESKKKAQASKEADTEGQEAEPETSEAT